ncbi:MAG: ribonuclease HI family protein [Dehalococcoidia bacterium]|nr:MAG: ribonuclease HI family protein [Dehalococcoidia bacterium]
MGKRLIIYTDGAAEPNPGRGAIGVVMVDEVGKVVAQISAGIGWATNNQAEYRAVIRGLEAAAKMGAEHIEVRSDSELVVKQIRGEYRVKNPGLKPLFEQVHQLTRKFQSYRIVHIPGGQNKADALSRKALSRASD